MPWSPWWLATLIVPTAYVAVIGVRYRGFMRQPCLVLARSPAKFQSRLTEIGGTGAAKTGTLVDLGFAVLLCTALGVILAAAGGPWWLVLLAAGLDFLEGRALRAMLNGSAPTRAAVHVLLGISIAKFIAYGACLIALAFALRDLL